VLVAVAVALALVGSLSKNSNTSTTLSTPTTVSTSATTSARRPGKHHRAAGTQTGTGTTTAKPPGPPPKPTSVTLKLVATSSVYVCLEDGNGNVLIPGVTFAAGSAIPVKSAKKLLLTLGNDAVQMKINGKSVPVTPGSPIGYEITPTKTTPLTAGHLPTCT
jgi:hypothetical protein